MEGTLGRYRLVDKESKSRNKRAGKYEQGFSSLGEYEEESPVKAGAEYMDSVIAMMKGMDAEESQTKRAISFDK